MNETQLNMKLQELHQLHFRVCAASELRSEVESELFEHFQGMLDSAKDGDTLKETDEYLVKCVANKKSKKKFVSIQPKAEALEGPVASQRSSVAEAVLAALQP